MKKISPMSYIYKTEIPEADWEKQFWILDFRLGLAEELHNPYLTIVYSVFSPNMCKAVRLI